MRLCKEHTRNLLMFFSLYFLYLPIKNERELQWILLKKLQNERKKKGQLEG